MTRHELTLSAAALLCCALFAGTAFAQTTEIKTPGLSITFDDAGLPISMKTARGEEVHHCEAPTRATALDS